MHIMWIIPPGFIVGVLVFDSLRKVFTEDDRVVWRLLADQPVTMGAGATIIGSALLWAALTAVGIF